MGEIKPGEIPVPRQQKIDLLQKVCGVLNDQEIDYFLTCGTLLGYMREGDFIMWDTDIDLGIFSAKEVQKLEEQFVKVGLRCSLFAPDHPFRISLKLQIFDANVDVDSRLYVDIFEFEKVKEGFIFRYTYIKWYFELIRRVMKFIIRVIDGDTYSEVSSMADLIEGSRLPARWKRIVEYYRKLFRKFQFKQGIHIFTPFTCVQKDWFGYPIMIPSEPIMHLELFYGSKWFIPNPNYTQSRERRRNLRRVML